MRTWTTTSADFASFLLVSQIDPEGIRQRLRLARKEMGVAQQELADLLEVHKRTIENYENTRVPDFRSLNRIAPVLNVSVEWLLHGDAANERAGGEVAERLASLEVGQAHTQELLAELLRRLPGEQDEHRAGSDAY